MQKVESFIQSRINPYIDFKKTKLRNPTQFNGIVINEATIFDKISAVSRYRNIWIKVELMINDIANRVRQRRNGKCNASDS